VATILCSVFCNAAWRKISVKSAKRNQACLSNKSSSNIDSVIAISNNDINISAAAMRWHGSGKAK